MTYETMLALAAFAFATSIAPGPNNLMLMASGANFGLRRTTPHMLGVSLGHAAMTALVGLGLAQAIAANPGLQTAMRAVGAVFVLWIAWKIATAARPGGGATAGARPLRFHEAAAFQWVNPKAWAMSLGAVAAYAPGGDWRGAFAVAAVFCAINLPSVAVWAGLGGELRRFIDRSGRRRAFNLAMAALLLASMAPVLLT